MHPKRTPSVILFVLLALLLATTSLYAAPSQRVIPADEDIPALPQTADSETAAKIQSAMSAAPLAVSLHATIMDWPAAPGGALAVLREGSNGYTCLPARAGRPTPDPMCLDGVWMEWFTARMAGEVSVKKEVGVAYMLQGGNTASLTDPSLARPPDGQEWNISPPHVMILSPNALDTDYYPTTPETGGPWVLFAGTPYEVLMVPVDGDLALHADRISDAMSAAPSHVSQDATVLEWPAAPGKPLTELRAGNTRYTCLPPRAGRPGPDPMCLDPVWMSWLQARMAGEVADKEEIGVAYMLQGGSSPSTSDPSLRQPPEGEPWVIDPQHVMILSPNPFDTDYFPTTPDGGGPWVLYAGTPYEILMVPVNLGLSDAQTHRALLPLPESLRASANIVGFDSDWNQVMLREGSSDMNCVAFAPFMAIQYAVCEHKSSEPFWVMGMQLRAGGMAQADIDQARIDAMVDGTLEIPVVGAARYFLLGGRPQNLSSLMAVHLPHATSESTGFSTEPDNYRPWLMDAGTPNAHVMMPGN
ncbi:MAG: hypothetical protein WBO46_08205 [Caldilineaceae bacterium]